MLKKLGFIAFLHLTLLAGCGESVTTPLLTTAVPPSLSARAQQASWRAVGALHNSAFRESDIMYDTDTQLYYLFATGSYAGQGQVDMYVATTPEGLTQAAPVRLSPSDDDVTGAGVYPTVVKDPSTGYWHLYAARADRGVIRHFVSTVTPTASSFALVTGPGTLNFQLVDTQVRKHPTNGRWYAVGLANTRNYELTITYADTPHGQSAGSGLLKGRWLPVTSAIGNAGVLDANGDDAVFADVGQPTWATYSTPDPNLAFTSDGRTWVLFTGRSEKDGKASMGIVEVDLATGKAKGQAQLINNPPPSMVPGPNPFFSDLNLVSGVSGQPDRIFGFTNDGLALPGGPSKGDYPLGVLELLASP